MAEEQTQNNRVQYTEQELRERAAAFDQRFGNNAYELLNGRPSIDPAEIQRTNEFIERAGDRAVEERTVQQQQTQETRERAAVSVGWVPGGATDAQRDELRADWQRRQEWNATIEGGSVPANAPERGIETLRPPAEMTKPEIVTEARDIHAQFVQMMERYEQTSGTERSQLREEMKPLVTRENELREKYTGRVKVEMSPNQLSQDQVPEQSIGYGR
jgi:hypothetical protein